VSAHTRVAAPIKHKSEVQPAGEKTGRAVVLIVHTCTIVRNKLGLTSNTKIAGPRIQWGREGLGIMGNNASRRLWSWYKRVKLG